MGSGKRANQAQCTVNSDKASVSSSAHSQTPFNQKGLHTESLKKVPLTTCPKSNHSESGELPTVPLPILFEIYISYAIGLVICCVKDFIDKIINSHEYTPYQHCQGYAPIVDGFEGMFHRRLYTRIRDCFSRPVTGVAGRTIRVLQRTSKDFNKTYEYTGKSSECLNLSSYNYLGFSQSSGDCLEKVVLAIQGCGVTTNSSRNETGFSALHREAEQLVARFVGKPDCIIQSQGFSTNSTTLPILVGKGSLIISDELNHSSLVVGARLSGANIKVFKHNCLSDLESNLREAISQGQPRTHRPWKQILLVIEGLYSMEGSIPMLNEIIEMKKKYKFYIYLDEAHSIGALGPRGRGVCDHLAIDPKDIDIMMGTFTKSFGAAGGYIAGAKELIDVIRVRNHNNVYGESMSIPVLVQTISSMRVIMGLDGGDEGKQKLERLAFNARYFHTELKKLGLSVVGSPYSPVVPFMLFHPAKIAAFSRECLKRKLAVVVVGYPVTSLTTSRVRFCLSSAHSKEDLDLALKHISEVADDLFLKNVV